MRPTCVIHAVWRLFILVPSTLFSQVPWSVLWLCHQFVTDVTAWLVNPNPSCSKNRKRKEKKTKNKIQEQERIKTEFTVNDLDNWGIGSCFQETLQIPFLNGSIDFLPYQWSKFSMERFLLWRASLVWWGICLWVTVDLVPVYALIYSILDARNTDLGSGRLQASGYVLSSHLTSQAPASTSNVPSTRARASAAYTILPPAINWCG